MLKTSTSYTFEKQVVFVEHFYATTMNRLRCTAFVFIYSIQSAYSGNWVNIIIGLKVFPKAFFIFCICFLHKVVAF